MARDPKIEVEQLGDAAWARVERAVFDRLDETQQRLPATAAPRWKLGFALVLAGSLAAVIGVIGWRVAAPSIASRAPSRIVTGESGSRLSYGEAILDVAPRSALLISGDEERGVLLVVEAGQVSCEVAPRRGRPPFLALAGDVRVTVVGTRFSVTRTGDGAIVEVQKGVVEVTAQGQTTRVAAGERWPSVVEAAAPPAAGPPSTHFEPVHVHATPVRRSSTPSARPSEPVITAPAAPAPASAAPAPPSGAPVAPPPIAPTPTDEQRYDQAARQEARDPQAAIAGYRALSTGSGPWAANALFAHGRLQADRGHRDEARRLLREYLSRFPTGPNREDARQLLDRLR